jgi:hypothetical protein
MEDGLNAAVCTTTPIQKTTTAKGWFSQLSAAMVNYRTQHDCVLAGDLIREVS